MELSFAPMEGITGSIYRRVHARFFPGADVYYAPFLAPDGTGRFKGSALRELLSENNTGLTVIPQLLVNTPEPFLAAAETLGGLGYKEINLNVGCPSGTVVAKHKGAGMLEDLESLSRCLDTIFSRCPQRISVKTRLGLGSTAEFPAILSLFRRYPLARLIVHARDRAGMYQSMPDLDTFALALIDSPFPVVYNGNVFSSGAYEAIVSRFPTLSGVMLGRGAVADPALFRRIRGGSAMSVEELSSLLGISVSTLRKQLAVMQENGLVIRTYGGVMPVNRVPDETFESKLHKNIAEKRRIAECARTLIPNGSSIALGSGTSIYGLANLLDDMTKGTVYTNSMQAADLLGRSPGLEVHISSGILRSRTGTIIGSEAADYFRSLKQVDYAFIGCDAIDSSGAVLSDNLSVASVEKIILNCAKRRYILCDSSKLGQSAVAKVTELKDCDGLITLHSPAAENYASMTKLLYA